MATDKTILDRSAFVTGPAHTAIQFATEEEGQVKPRKMSLQQVTDELATVGGSFIVTVDTVADFATLSATTADNTLIQTRGYNTIGDGGAFLYVYRTTGRPTADAVRYFDGSQADDYLEAANTDRITLLQAGCTTAGTSVANQPLIQAALDSFDTVVVPPGTWKYHGYATFKSDQTITGTGTLKTDLTGITVGLDDGAHVEMLLPKDWKTGPTDNVTVEGITLDQDVDNNDWTGVTYGVSGVAGDGQAACIATWGTRNMMIRNVTTQNARTDNIYIAATHSTAGVQANTQQITVLSCNLLNAGRQNVSVIAGEDINILYNYMTHGNRVSPKSAIDLEPNATQTFDISNVKIIGNKIKDALQGILLAEPTPAETIDNVIIDGNEISLTTAEASIWGIRIHDATNVLVANTRIENADSIGLECSGTSTGELRNVHVKDSVVGCKFLDTTHFLCSDMRVEGTVSSSAWWVVDPAVVHCDNLVIRDHASAAAPITATSADTSINGGRVYGTSYTPETFALSSNDIEVRNFQVDTPGTTGNGVYKASASGRIKGAGNSWNLPQTLAAGSFIRQETDITVSTAGTISINADAAWVGNIIKITNRSGGDVTVAESGTTLIGNRLLEDNETSYWECTTGTTFERRGTTANRWRVDTNAITASVAASSAVSEPGRYNVGTRASPLSTAITYDPTVLGEGDEWEFFFPGGITGSGQFTFLTGTSGKWHNLGDEQTSDIIFGTETIAGQRVSIRCNDDGSPKIYEVEITGNDFDVGQISTFGGTTHWLRVQNDSTKDLKRMTLDDALADDFYLLKGAPTDDNGAATKKYVDDNVISSIKPNADLATTANITLSGEQTIDGTLTSTSRVLVKDQSTGAENGIYTTASGAWTRTTDFDAGSEASGAVCYVNSGTANGGKGYHVTTQGTITIDTTAITWEERPNVNATALNTTFTAYAAGGIASTDVQNAIEEVADERVKTAITWQGTGAIELSFDGGAHTQTATALSSSSTTVAARIKSASITSAMLGASIVTEGKIGADQVTNAKLNDMGAYTVKLRATGTLGDPGDLAIAASGMLGRVGSGDVVSMTPKQVRDQISQGEIAMVDGTLDCNDARTHVIQDAATFTIPLPVNYIAGEDYHLIIEADATQTNTLTWAAGWEISTGDSLPATRPPTGRIIVSYLVSNLTAGGPTYNITRVDFA